MKKLNKLEEIQKSQIGIIFIKSYPILNQIKKIQSSEKQLLELILSYQENKQIFKMSYKSISSLLGVKYQSVKNAVHSLKKRDYITVITTKNFNGIKGGSSTQLSVNVDNIITEINNRQMVLEKPIQSEINSQNESLKDYFDEKVSRNNLLEFTSTYTRKQSISSDRYREIKSLINNDEIQTINQLVSELKFTG